MRARNETQLLHHGGRSGGWGSLGWWGGDEAGAGAELAGRPERTDYHAACTRLATQVGRAAGLGAGEHVLSVACGAGEELRLWVQHFGAAAVVGVGRDAALARQAGAATQALPGVRVLQGSGTALGTLGLPPAGFDRVLCVDAAYHLQPRGAFLQAAFTLLRPGGTLAYTDLVLDEERSPAPRARWCRAWLQLGTRLCGLAPGSLRTGPEQLQRLHDAGFTHAALQRCDEAVLGGYTRFVQRQARGLPGGPWQAGWRRVAVTALLIPPCRAAGLGYAMLSAARPVDRAAPLAEVSSAAATASAERTALSSNGTPASA